MKNHIYKIVGLLAAMTTLAVSGAQAQVTTKAHVPFDFSARGQSISAGDCLMTRISEQAISVRSKTANGGSTIVLTRAGGRGSTNQSNWVFRRYGDMYFLAGVNTPNYELVLPKSKTKLSLLKELKRTMISKNHPSTATPEIVAVNVKD